MNYLVSTCVTGRATISTSIYSPCRMVSFGHLDSAATCRVLTQAFAVYMVGQVIADGWGLVGIKLNSAIEYVSILI